MIILKIIAFVAVGVYVIIASILLASMIFTDHTVTVTNYKTNERTEIEGIKKLGYFLLMVLLWPVTLHIGKD